MPTATINNVTGKREWEGNSGPMVDYQLHLSDIGDCYMTKKPESPAPSPGESLEYEVVKQDKHGTKIKKVFANGGGAAPQGGVLSAATPSPISGDRERSIERQVAAKCAAQILTGGDAKQFPGLAEAIARWISDPPAQPAPQVNEQQAVAQAATSEVPPDTSGFGPPAQQDDDIPFAPSVI